METITIKEVVETWDKNHSDMQTETLKGKNIESGGKIARGRFFNKIGKQAVIKFAPGYPYKHWGERACYVFTFDFDGRTDELANIEVSFERRTQYDPNSQAFYEFLEKYFAGKDTKHGKILIRRGTKNPSHLVLKIKLNPASSVKDICDAMYDLINLTQEKRDDMKKFIKPTLDEIFDTVEEPTKLTPDETCDAAEEPTKSTLDELLDAVEESIKPTPDEIFDAVKESAKSTLDDFLEDEDEKEIPLTEEEEKIFCKIMDKYGINDEKSDLYKYCEEIYILTIKILFRLYVYDKDAEDKNIKDLEVSYYTKKSIAQKLLIEQCGEFRLYYIRGMNDPNEGKTLLLSLGIKSEELSLPKEVPFIACFSLEVNSLNQFRLYGKEKDKEATGVSILFRPNFFKGDEENRPLCRCIYIDPDNEEIKSISFSKTEKIAVEKRLIIVKYLFKKLKEAVRKLLQCQSKTHLKMKHELAKDLLTHIRYLVKDYAFEEERECRIIDMRNKEDEIDKRNKRDEEDEIDEKGIIKTEGERLYVKICGIKDYVSKIYFAPLTEGVEAFEIESGKKCIKSRHPYKSTQSQDTAASNSERQLDISMLWK